MSEKKDAAQLDLFKHIDVAHQDLAKASSRIGGSNTVGWMGEKAYLELGTRKIEDEKLDTLTKLNKNQIILLASEETVAAAVNDTAALAFCEKIKRLSISEKGGGRKDTKEILSSIKQTVSIPTTLQKVRRVFSNQGHGNQEEPDNSED